MIRLYFWFALDRLFCKRFSHRYVWAYRICNKLGDACEREDRWDLM